jgi:heat shock protein HtpX
MMIGYHFAGRLGLFLGFIVTVGFHALIFFFGDSPLLPYLKARLIAGNDPWGLQDLLSQQSLVLQMPKPKLYVVESPAAFAFSLTHNNSICVSIGLLQRLSKEELEAVIAHQICHLYHLNTFAFSAAHILAFSLVGFGNILDQTFVPLAKVQKYVQQPFTAIFSPVAWLILKLTISDKVYFQNDEMAAALLKDRRHLAEALWKLNGLNRSYPLTLPPCNNHFFTVNPSDLGEKNWFLLAHPKVDIRIKKLVGYYPI